jgi:hypothetical protein
MFDERRYPGPERRGVPLAKVDLVLCAADPEPHRLVRRVAVQIIFERDRDLGAIPDIHVRAGASPPHRTYHPPCPRGRTLGTKIADTLR